MIILNKIPKSKKMTHIQFNTVWRNPIHFIACGFGIGTLPILPGTFGTMVGVVFYLMMRPLPIWLYVLITLAMVLAGIYLCGAVNRAFGTDDHPAAVWDEIAVFPIVMVAIPYHWYYLLVGFILFRLFDIWKPWPIRWLDQNIHGGIGVMLDDVVAALFAWIILFIWSLSANG